MYQVICTTYVRQEITENKGRNRPNILLCESIPDVPGIRTNPLTAAAAVVFVLDSSWVSSFLIHIDLYV